MPSPSPSPTIPRGLTLAVLALLLAPALAPVATAQSSSWSSFALQGVERDGDEVTFHLRNGDAYVRDVTASVLADGSLAALPEQTRDWWDARASATFTFTLVEDVEEVTLRLRFQDRNSVRRVESIDVPLPPGDPEEASDPRIVVVDASTYRNVTVNFTLRNMGDGASAPLVASVEDGDGVKIATPYFREVPAIPEGGLRNVTFNLTSPASVVTLVLDADGETTSTTVEPRPVGESDDDASDDPPDEGTVTLTTDLPHRESEPGTTVDYAVRIRNEGPEGLFRLRAEGLPQGYNVRFTVQQSGISSLFMAKDQTRDVMLSVTVPQTATESVGDALRFSVIAEEADTDVEAARLDVSLTLRGRGELEIQGENWFSALTPGKENVINVTVRNKGTGPLYNVRMEADDRPAGWRILFEPARIPTLEAGEEQEVTVRVRAPEDVGTGKYVVSLTASNYETQARARTLSLDVATTESSNLMPILAAAFAGLVAVVIIVKVKRR